MELEKYEAKMIKEVAPLEAASVALLSEAKTQQVTNDDEVRAANEIKKRINAHSRTVKDMRLELTRPIDHLKDVLISREREILLPLDEAKNTIGGRILDYEEELERKRLAEEKRLADVIGSINILFHSSMTVQEVATAKAAAKTLMANLNVADRDNAQIKSELVRLSNEFTNRLADIEAEERRRIEQERLQAEAAKQSDERARLAAEQARIDEDKRQIEDEKRRHAQAVEALRLEHEALEARKAAEKAAAARPKSNIIEHTEFIVVDPAAVPRELCSPDDKLIRAWIKDSKIEPGVHNGIQVTVRKGVR